MNRNQIVVERARTAICVVSLVAIVVLAGGAKKGKDEPGVRELGTVKPKELTEISGMAASRLNPGVLWVGNDGDSGWLYAVRTSGKLAGAVKMPTRVLDVEEIAMGDGPEPGVDYLYVGDIGDNDARRPEISVVRVPEPVLEGAGTVSLRAEDWEQFRLVYPDGSHNAEAMFVDPTTHTLYIMTKEARGTRLYEIAIEALRVGERNTLQFAADLDVDSVSAAAISPDGSLVVLRREDRGWLWYRQSGQSVADTLQEPPRSVPVRGHRQGKNGEAITFRPNGTCYYTLSEGKKQTIYEFDVAAAETSTR